MLSSVAAVAQERASTRKFREVVGGWGRDAGRRCVTWCGAGETDWRAKELAVEPRLKQGNESYARFTLARGASNQVVATRGGEALSRASVMVQSALPAPMPNPRVVH